MKTVLSAAALFGLLLAASNPAAATETFHRAAPKSTAPVAGTPGASDLGGIIYIHDDDNDDDHYGNRPKQRYNQWPYPQQNNNWPYQQQNNNWPYTQQYNGNYPDYSKNSPGRHDWSNPWRQPYQDSHHVNRQPLPRHVIVHKLRMQHFYNVQEIKAKKGYYRVYAFDRYRRPVSVIVDPYSGRILRVGHR
jgi:hypothetical protein